MRRGIDRTVLVDRTRVLPPRNDSRRTLAFRGAVRLRSCVNDIKKALHVVRDFADRRSRRLKRPRRPFFEGRRSRRSDPMPMSTRR